MKKLLYVDAPFAGIAGGDTNRSSFIWEALCSEFQADLLIVKTPAYRLKKVPEHQGFHKLFYVASSPGQPGMPKAIYSFHKNQIEKFTHILEEGGYSHIVFRFLSTFALAKIAAKTLPHAKIAIDVDMLFSRIAALSWQQNKSVHNRFHFFEMHKLRVFERHAFQQPFSFFFTNPIERNLAIDTCNLPKGRAFLFPNMMPQCAEKTPAIRQPYILFFGTLNSMANSDALCYFMKDIYPLVKHELEARQIKIHIVGKNPLPLYDKYADATVKIVGAVDEIRSHIASALFVILPLRVASGTRTRILEAAELSAPVISSSIGAEGFNFKEDELLFADSAQSFAQAILRLVSNPELAEKYGKKLQQAAEQSYSKEKVLADFIRQIQNKELTGLKIALITNRFYPEVGGAETNIHFQAIELAKKHQLTVYCPKRIDAAKRVKQNGFTTIRMHDVLAPKGKYPNLKAKTLCPSLAWHLFWQKPDIIQCFPALNYNNILAFIFAKLFKVPFIMVFFDFIDYAGLIESEGKIDPDILSKIKPRFYQIPVLKGMDFAFAIADKEIAFLKKYNPNVAYSPVPVNDAEFKEIQATPPLMKTFNKDTFVFLCLGRISQIKGQIIALEAFAKVHKDLLNAKLIFVGRTDYEPALYEEMQALILQHDLQDKVYFTGMVERTEVIAWLQTADIHVIPVRFMNSGAVVVESFFADTPVLQSDVVDPNLIQEGVNGYLFKNGSVDECAQKMLLAFQERDKLPGIAANGKKQVQDKYTYRYLDDLYNDTYYQLLNKEG